MRTWRVRAYAMGYGVINGEGQRISPVLRSQETAQDWLDRRIAAAKPRRRPCLACSKRFDSDGVHDRMCAECGRAGGLSYAAPDPRRAVR